ncbi:FtsK/SpoIIIE family DNA translocase [Pseudemcibacter aquimaris]|uniref:FtsK/SpoIIIE family DNA translocase n=1 Tax=Pseudemcibacter aquimaris TaxID=2857064 RepID=UPI0020136B39|nr:DNA translocase FtsK 4TM domain-containing protein [Pseudemcibacter aquimaris]MCC3861684.1 DNA translocase FtsK 4TM domain-containing protein [Pseudemcibacter aquimaris]WDU58455.1 DNA translocase FtsK 4TM domain-containing protein [Pseudemcibacter aquimaris]
MATRRKTIKKNAKKSLLPASVSEFLHKALIRLWGSALIALFVALVASFFTYDINDPSWNNVVEGDVTNILGQAGSHVSDIFMQTLGLASYILVLPLVTWGWRVMSLKGLPYIFMHLLMLPLLAMMAATAFSTIPPYETWPLGDVGLGGVMGNVLLDYVSSFIAWTGISFYPVIIGVLFTILAAICFFYTSGLDRDEWSQMGHGIKIGAAAILMKLIAGAVYLRQAFKGASERSKQKEVVKKAKTAARKEPPLKKSDEPEKEKRAIPIIDPEKKSVRVSKRETKESQPMLDILTDGEFALPSLSLLSPPKPVEEQDRLTHDALEQNARMLEAVLDDFGVKGEITKVRPGPVVTLYELEPAPGTKSSRVINLADDIARSMSAVSARVAVVPGKNAIGIELPNSAREIVSLREILSSSVYEDSKAKLPMALGKDIGGEPIVVDIATMPHLLVAGTTGSGKSVAINVMILSLLYKMTPAECRLIMVDPKMLELSVYDDIPHLLTPVVTDPKKAVVALKWAVREMEQRYQNMAKLQVRNITAYNKRLEEARKKGENITRKVQTGFDQETGKPIYEEENLDLTPLPMIVVIVDEMADLMLVAGKDIEALIQRLAQMARAAGIHLIMATQRPSVDVITGTIKANFPTRVAFQVTSKIDSRTILGEQGAEQLLGMGDMLFMAGGGRITRVHGPFVADDEVENVVTALKKQGAPEYLTDIVEEPDEGFDSQFLQNSQMTPGAGKPSGDELYDRAVAIVARDQKASTSYIQRQLQIGYNRAANIIEKMEREGVVSSANHVGKREVLVQDHSEEY